MHAGQDLRLSRRDALRLEAQRAIETLSETSRLPEIQSDDGAVERLHRTFAEALDDHELRELEQAGRPPISSPTCPTWPETFQRDSCPVGDRTLPRPRAGCGKSARPVR